MTTDLSKLTAVDFEDKIDSRFILELNQSDRTEIVFTLVDCQRNTESDFKGRFRDPFSLLFEAPLDVILPPQNYAFKHEAFADGIHIFVVPIGQSKTATKYEAVFT